MDEIYEELKKIYERIKIIEEKLDKINRRDKQYKPIHIKDKVKVNLFSDEELEKLLGEKIR